MTKYIGYIYFDNIDKFVVCYGKKYYDQQLATWLFDLLFVKTYTVDELSGQLERINNQLHLYWYSNALNGSLMAKWLKNMGANRYVPDLSLECCHQNLIAGIGSQVVGVSLALKKYLLDGLKNALTTDKVIYPPSIIASGILVTLALQSQSLFAD